MYDRAPRPTANYLVGSTKDNVGPGTYDVPLPRSDLLLCVDLCVIIDTLLHYVHRSCLYY